MSVVLKIMSPSRSFPRSSRGRRLALAAVAAWIAAGCGGDGLPRQAVSGSVTLDGRPLESGAIAFQPTSPDGGGIAVGAVVQGGSFSVSRAEGPTPGNYRVSITSPREGKPTARTQAARPGDGDAPPAVETIPPRYNATTTLTAEVKADGGNTFEFPLKSR